MSRMIVVLRDARPVRNKCDNVVRFARTADFIAEPANVRQSVGYGNAHMHACPIKVQPFSWPVGKGSKVPRRGLWSRERGAKDACFRNPVYGSITAPFW